MKSRCQPNHLKRALRLSALCILPLTPLTPASMFVMPPAVSKQKPNDRRPSLTWSRPAPGQRDTWYEFLLKQFNPDSVDYGASMERRRQAFLNSTVRNPYFKYSAAVTVGLLVVVALYAKKVIDHRRVLWTTAEMMADLYNHDAYSRSIAREAIKKYNQHMERCNRLIEAGENVTSAAARSAELDRLRGELRTIAEERDSYKRERDLAKTELTEKERILANLSLRLDSLGRKAARSSPQSGERVASHGASAACEAPDVSMADQDLVKHINNLQEQLYVERKENRRLKGA